MKGRNWRRPTLAEARQPLPSARLRLTAEFGMGSGRTTALWPPINLANRKFEFEQEATEGERRGREKVPGPLYARRLRFNSISMLKSILAGKLCWEFSVLS